jgi:hypothetical protein
VSEFATAEKVSEMLEPLNASAPIYGPIVMSAQSYGVGNAFEILAEAKIRRFFEAKRALVLSAFRCSEN